MPRAPRWTASEAERALLRTGFQLLRSKGSHRIYLKGGVHIVVPFRAGKILHPKIVRQILNVIGPDE